MAMGGQLCEGGFGAGGAVCFIAWVLGKGLGFYSWVHRMGNAESISSSLGVGGVGLGGGVGMETFATGGSDLCFSIGREALESDVCGVLAAGCPAVLLQDGDQFCLLPLFWEQCPQGGPVLPPQESCVGLALRLPPGIPPS